MTPDLYETWLTAGNTLQPAGDWLAANWGQLAILAACLAFAAWAIRRWIRGGVDDYRTCNDRDAADRITDTEDRPEPAEPGHDNDLLAKCNQILDATNTARKEDR